MEPSVLIALITGGATVLVASIGAGVSIWSLRASLANGARLKVVETHTNGLMAKIGADALAKGIEEGHTTGVAQGVEAGIKSEQDRKK